jgi:hypothetical protein
MTWNSRGPGTVSSVSVNAKERAERKNRTAAPEPEVDPLDQEPDVEPNAFDEADELAEMSDQDFYAMLRRDVKGVRDGSVISMAEAEAAKAARSPKDRPWSRRRKARDRYGRVL